ncbi:MAG: rhomboid family intramembrane serine protease [Bacillota bacterium]
MIPLRDTIRTRRFPVVTVAIIVANLTVFLFSIALSPGELQRLVTAFGIVPALQIQMFLQAPLVLDTWIPVVTSMFLHGGWFHVLGNMLYLWVFGDNVEDVLGRGRFLLFYLLAGFAGGLAHIVSAPGSLIPTIGASGAVAGVLGAYFITFPSSRILALVPILFFITFVKVPAVLFLFLWIGLQLLYGVLAVTGPANMVAWWAHVGGFAAGMLLMKFMAAGSRTAGRQ